MDRPRRRSAGRPAGPPDPAAQPAPPTDAGLAEAVSVPAEAPTNRDAAPPADAADAPPVAAPPDDPADSRPTDPAPPPASPPDPPAEPAGQHRRRSRSPRQTDRRTEGRPDQAIKEQPGRRDDGQPRVDTRPGRADVPQGQAGARLRDGRRGESAVERSLRALVSLRTTQLPPTVAMRAREVAVPSAADLAAADEEVVIVRRHYVPPTPLSTKKPDPTRSPGEQARNIDQRLGRRRGPGQPDRD